MIDAGCDINPSCIFSCFNSIIVLKTNDINIFLHLYFLTSFWTLIIEIWFSLSMWVTMLHLLWTFLFINHYQFDLIRYIEICTLCLKIFYFTTIINAIFDFYLNILRNFPLVFNHRRLKFFSEILHPIKYYFFKLKVIMIKIISFPFQLYLVLKENKWKVNWLNLF